jgi:hypothetical protein
MVPECVFPLLNAFYFFTEVLLIAAAVLPNGTIMVLGGETGSNASPEPNVEILPTPEGGDTVIYLDWLNRTDPNNLYPFVFVLPSGNLFVGVLIHVRFTFMF